MKKNKKERRSVVVSLLTNICLVAVIVITFFACGLVKTEVAVTVFKSYNGVIYAGNETSGKVGIMINVYWGTEYLEDMLKTLEENNAKATFFVGGTWVQENPELLDKIYKAGHEIGSHGTHHKEHGKLSYDANKKEIQDCHDSVLRVLNINMDLFAPPGGSYNSNTVKSASDLGYKTILWTKDTIDWRDQDEELIYSRATENIQSGDLILMHPTNATRNVLDKVLKYINGKKLTLDTVSNTIKE